MPKEPDAPKRRVSQAPAKIIACYGGCGTLVEFRTNPRVCCRICKSDRKRASARISMEKQRRKRGIPKVKGQEISCARCQAVVILRRNKRAKYCAACYRIVNDQEAPKRAAKKRRTAEGREYQNNWHRQRRKIDPAWRVSAHMRVLIHRALGSGKAGRSWREFVPYTLDELMRHLERQFVRGMTWENRDRWHIDHIQPLAQFNYSTADDPDFKAAWAITNLRPLWKAENLSKNAKRILLL